jgi:hypothetical protein
VAFGPEQEVGAAVSRMLQVVLVPGVRVVRSDALTQERSVWRCHLEGATGSPPSVIARTSRQVGGWRTDPSYLWSDYIATAFMWDRCPGVTARIIVADVDAGLYVTEDLGAGPSLADLLTGTARSEAAQGLSAFAAALGRMHAATAGLDAEYYRRRHLLGPADPVRYRTYLGELSLEAAARRVLGTRVPDGRDAPRRAREEVQVILTILAQPGGFLALSNGDPCPYNCLLPDGRARLFDFELAGYRHALLDAAYLHLGFQWCYRPGRIPPDVLREAETAYRLEAGSGIQLVLDEPVYQRGLTAAAAAWATLAGSMVTRYLDRTGTLAAADTARQAATIRQYLTMPGSASCFPALSDWLSEIAAAFDREQPTDQHGLYRSFDR